MFENTNDHKHSLILSMDNHTPMEAKLLMPVH